jgi:hypothetical protein
MIVSEIALAQQKLAMIPAETRVALAVAMLVAAHPARRPKPYVRAS